MSGGSYNYLAYAQDLEDLLGKRNELKCMAERLAGLSETEFPGAAAAAESTRHLLLKIQIWESNAKAHASFLADVWKCVEWWDSCDYGPDQVRSALRELLGGDSGQGTTTTPQA